MTAATGLTHCSPCAAAVIRVRHPMRVDSSEHCGKRSRLSCSLRFENAFDGLRVTIAPED